MILSSLSSFFFFCLLSILFFHIISVFQFLLSLFSFIFLFICLYFLFFFFFSSRRRHTRYWRDWSSDVCSSDLLGRVVEVHPDDAAEVGLAAGQAAELSSRRGLIRLPVKINPRLSRGVVFVPFRSEERRVGKECRSRWSPYH